MDDGSAPGESRITRAGGRPAEQLAQLLERTENGKDVAGHLAGVRSALMHYCGLESCRHTKGPPRPADRRTFRHSFLLPDGGVQVLWELEHDAEADGVLRRWVFAEPGELAVAEWEADAAFGPSPGERALPPDPAEGFGPPRAEVLLLPEQEGCRRAYTENGSPDHARRLLRRAANSNAPGAEVHQRLRTSVAHAIGIVTRRSAVVDGRLVSWSLYEHAFLLPDGTEVSLWEIDHTRTPSGAPVCEVYLSRDAALDTAVRRIEAG